MKPKNFILLAILMTVFACSDEDVSQPVVNSNIDGQYVGTFDRDGNISNVQLDLNNGVFTGQSDVEKYPAICNGTYALSGNDISFVNECVWTAEFDGTLILGDDWSYSLNNNTLILIKQNGDQYTLTRQ